MDSDRNVPGGQLERRVISVTDNLAPSGRGLGVDGSLHPSGIAAIAREVERLGYQSFWMNVVAGQSEPTTILAAALRETSSVDVGIGVVPLDAYDLTRFATSVNALPGSRRTVVGLGSGRLRRGVPDFMTHAVAAFREACPGVRVALGGYGPKMLQLGGSLADVVCLNWLTPERLAWSLDLVAKGAGQAGRISTPRLVAYVRAAVGPDGRERIHSEWKVYQSFPHALGTLAGAPPSEPGGIIAERPEEVTAQMSTYTGVHPVIRPLASSKGDLAELLHLAQFFAP